ncbi:hypothetical protein NW754_006523 [Fusarium falciforme]|nr:hypothetical protein NW754_006523 [Fusarium falciforme]KAJ4209036.1 hypothetical protein NW767_000946 [Fusarium falciforme]KAJ4262346.1 hypothetical protein NW757_000606 [Fusarium falciforme]
MSGHLLPSTHRRPQDNHHLVQPHSQPDFEQDGQNFHQTNSPMTSERFSSGPLWAAKLNLRLLSISFDAVLLITVLTLIAGSSPDATTIILFGPLTCMAFAWSFVDAVYLCTRNRRGHEPITRMKFDLVLCLAFVIASSLIGYLGTTDHAVPTLDQTTDEPHLATRALFCFGIAEVFVHSLLFVIAHQEWKASTNEFQISSTPSADDPLPASTWTVPSPKSGPGRREIVVLRDEEEGLLADAPRPSSG